MQIAKKISFLFAAAVLVGIAGADNAIAQVSCTANGAPVLVRSTGLAEATGSMVLSCTASGAASASSLTASIQPAAAIITNNPVSIVPGPCPTQASPFAPTITFSQGAVALGGSNNTTCAGIVSGNTVTFATPVVVAGGTFTMTIGVAGGVPASAPIRANINASGIVFPAQVQGSLSTPGGSPISITNSLVNVAIPQAPLSATFGTAPGFAQCGSANVTGGLPTTTTLTASIGATSQSAFSISSAITVVRPSDNSVRSPSAVQVVTVTEAFPSAWAVFGPSITSPGEGADSTQGTRIQVDLTNYPSNLFIAAPNYLQTGVPVTAGVTTQLGLVIGVASPAFFASPSAGNQFGGLTIVTGSSLIYEVTSTSAAVAESINIPLVFFTTGTVAPAGIVTAAVGLGPVSNVGTPVASPIPRFTASTTIGNVLTVIGCFANLLFPHVYNTAGYDTGFSIANTTADIFGTTPQAGACVYNFFGTNAPNGGTFTSPPISGGQVDTRLLSVIAPGFSGYVIVQCNFQLGHGYAVIQNGYPGGQTTTSFVVEGRVVLQPANISNTSATGRRGLASAGPSSFGETLGE